MKLPRSIMSLAVFSLALAACGDSPTVVDDDPGTQREIKAAPAFAADINEIFQRTGCSSGNCHGTAGGRAGLALTASAAANFTALVNVQATSENFLLVEPSNANDSYLVIKVEGRQTAGQRMPIGGSLDNIDITNIKNWINTGAPNN